MSKLYEKYLELKKIQKEKIYLFKSGIFYIALDEDAKKLNEKFGLKLTNFTPEVVKSGFPVSNLSKYLEKLDKVNMRYELIDNNYFKIDSPTAYIKSISIKNILNSIKNLELDSITPKEAYNILYNLQKQALEVEVLNDTDK